MTHDQKALEILRVMAQTAAEGKKLTIAEDWGFGTATVIDQNGAHTHVGADFLESEQKNFEAFVDQLHGLLVEKRGLSWATPRASGERRPNALRDHLALVGEILAQIRGIASDGVGLGHASSLGRGHFDAESACKAIYSLADAAHNLPEEFADNAPDRISSSLARLAAADASIFGSRSTLQLPTRPECSAERQDGASHQRACASELLAKAPR